MASRWVADPRLHGIALIVSVGVAYVNALWGPFQFDDNNVITHNAAVHSWQALWETMPGIRALLKLTYVANWQSGFDAIGFHAVNVAIHMTNAILVYALVRRWWPRLTGNHASTQWGALLVALIFALHPAQTEAVTYISGRSGSLMATFYLSAFWITERDSPRYAQGFTRFAVLLLFVLALASKEIAWILPLALMLRDKAIYNRRWRDAFHTHSLLFIAMVAAAAAVILVPGYWRLLIASLSTRTLGENLLSQIEGVWYLLAHPLLSLDLNIDPSLPEHAQWNLLLAVKAAVLLGALVSAFLVRARYRWLAFGIAWFFLHLAPTNSILPRYDLANDRQLYLAMVGPALIAAVLVTQIRRVAMRTILTVALCLTLGIATVVRNMDYASEVALWEATAAKSSDKARVWNNLGYARQRAGNRDGAKLAYDRALEIDPEHINARINRYTLE